jgi:hypothetical protein
MKVRLGEGAETSTRGACAPQSTESTVIDRSYSSA